MSFKLSVFLLRNLPKVVACLVLLFAFRCFADDPQRPFIVKSYVAEVQPNLKNKTITGKTSISVIVDKSVTEISFPLNEFQIDQVQLDGKSSSFEVRDGKLFIPVKSGRSAKLKVSYHGSPKSGLNFGDDFAYTAFSTCHWMICDEDPGMKSNIEIQVLAPKEYSVIASGKKIKTIHEAGNISRHIWREDRPYASYVYGFAVGKFKTLTDNVGKEKLHYLGIGQSEEDLQKKFQDTPRMLKFLESKAGVPLPHGQYTQVLVPGDEAQEESSFSVIGTNELDPILKDPHEDWAIVHELAHQWWGNLITCKSWQHFWLNEGIVVFIVAAYKEERWGKVDYEKEMALAKKRYQHAIDARLDVPLTYSGKYPSLSMKRSIVYSKGALFMDALRKEMGD